MSIFFKYKLDDIDLKDLKVIQPPFEAASWY